MSGPVAIAAVKFLGTAMAAKSAIEGIKEGNLLKAVVGGVGAYYGASSLTAGGAGAGTAAGAGGQGAVAKGGATAAASGGSGTTALSKVAEAANPELGLASRSLARTAAEEGAQSLAASSMAESGAQALEQMGAQINPELTMAGRDVARGAMPESPGLLKQTGNWMRENLGIGAAPGEVAGDGFFADPYVKGQTMSGLLQLGGGYMAGEAAEDKAKWELAQRERMYEEQRARRATTAASPYINTRWNPQTGRFEAIA